jgi:hypothetical protein
MQKSVVNIASHLLEQLVHFLQELHVMHQCTGPWSRLLMTWTAHGIEKSSCLEGRREDYERMMKVAFRDNRRGDKESWKSIASRLFYNKRINRFHIDCLCKERSHSHKSARHYREYEFMQGALNRPLKVTTKPSKLTRAAFHNNVNYDATWGDCCLYSLDKLHLLRIMPSYYSQLEFPVVS